MFGNTIGPAEIGIVLAIALLIFGPKKLPELGKGLGRGMRDFKRAVTGDDDADRQAEEVNQQVELVVETTPVAAVTVVEPTETEVVVAVGTAAGEGR